MAAMPGTAIQDVPLQDVEWEECCLQPGRNPELERELRAEFGMVPPAARYFADCPWIGRSLVAFHFERGRLVHLPADLTDRIGLVVSQDSSCRYCYAAHRLILRSLGLSESRIRRLEQDLLAADHAPRERAILDFARAFSRASPLPTQDDIRSLRQAGLDEAAVKEVAVVAGYSVAACRFSTLPALPPQRLEALPDRWFMRVARPLLARAIRRGFRPGRPERLAPEQAAGPFAFLVRELDGLPLARSMRQVIDEAWASPLLPRRTKGLVFAVVARGLGCPLSEQEATRLLAAEGLEPQALRPVLEHLASPDLDPTEREAVPFARETIWYRPASIQRRAREVCGQLGAPRFLELLGVAALANMVCRLAATFHALR